MRLLKFFLTRSLQDPADLAVSVYGFLAGPVMLYAQGRFKSVFLRLRPVGPKEYVVLFCHLWPVIVVQISAEPAPSIGWEDALSVLLVLLFGLFL